jgi:hypothetical protein
MTVADGRTNGLAIWRSVLPVGALVVVASVQVVLAKTASLTPWKGGGFGMFSTTDSADQRMLRVVVAAPERSEIIEITESLEDAAKRAAAFPVPRQLERLARLVVERERRHGRPVDTVQIECWRPEYDAVTLAASRRPVGELVYRAEPPAQTGP